MSVGMKCECELCCAFSIIIYQIELPNPYTLGPRAITRANNNLLSPPSSPCLSLLFVKLSHGLNPSIKYMPHCGSTKSI